MMFFGSYNLPCCDGNISLYTIWNRKELNDSYIFRNIRKISRILHRNHNQYKSIYVGDNNVSLKSHILRNTTTGLNICQFIYFLSPLGPRSNIQYPTSSISSNHIKNISTLKVDEPVLCISIRDFGYPLIHSPAPVILLFPCVQALTANG